VTAVDHVDLQVGASETVGLVGESGSGKSTIGRAVLGLTEASTGEIYFDGERVTVARRSQRRQLSRRLQVIFQDTHSSLNPTKTVGYTLAEPLMVHRRLRSAEVTKRVHEMLDRVGLPPAAAQRYPWQFSGGQRQRISIARALMLSPRLIICDEPVSALDLSVQAQILNLLCEFQEQFGLSYLFITHDMAVVRYLAHRVYVMYCGRIVESGTAEQVHDRPAHPNTRALLAAAPVADPTAQARRRSTQRELSIAVNNAIGTPEGCAFVPRCPYSVPRCTTRPPLETASRTASAAACWQRHNLPVWGSQDNRILIK
jgi:peptide/nickel transport system ATP-binding protein